MKRTWTLLICLLLLVATATAGDKLAPADLIAKSIDAIGTADVRARFAGMNASATGSYDVLTHGSGHLDGKATVIRADGRFQYYSEFVSPEYAGEQITLDGGRLDIASNGQTQQSVLAIFLYLHPYLVKTGLFGGVYNGNWPLIDPANHPAKMHLDGLKKLNGRQLWQLSYDPKGTEGDMYIKLYFEPHTFRHVATVFVFQGQTAHGIDVQHSDEKLEEDFSDFQKVGELMLPTTWTIHYTGTTQRAISARWVYKFPNIKVLMK